MSNANDGEQLEGAEIAVIGMAGRFPGAADLEQFWRNLRDGVESITFFSAPDLADRDLAPGLLDDPNFVRAGAHLDLFDHFDAAFFGYAPKEAELIDPQQRLFLEHAWAALEHAGYAPNACPGPVGVYAGASLNTYLLVNLVSHPDFVEALNQHQVNNQVQISVGSAGDFLTTRVSYKLNLTGPSHLIQSACSTSLVAIHVACQGLLNEECDMALAGGASINVNQRTGYYYQPEGIVSPDGHCRAFDAQAQGTILGSGVGVVVLKRLADALADGDTIYAVVKGSALNNDGAAKVGFTAPGVDGQARVITEALANAGVAAETISYIETHGTGTPLGDPIEVQALTRAFRARTDRTGFCAIGSVKTNVGHLDIAAGVAGFLKTALALHHRQLPPSLHFSQPNPAIDFASSPFYVNTALSEWRRGATPRRAGVSSFGIGGTNVHVILEEAPAVAAGGPSRAWQLLPLSARTHTALEATTASLAAHLRRHPEQDLADVAYTLQVGRAAFAHRRILVCRDRDDTLDALETSDQRRVLSLFQGAQERPVIFMFPGGGAQYVNMGRELYETEPAYRAQVDHCCALLRPHLGLDLREVLYPDHRPPTNDQRPTTNDRPFGSAQGRPTITDGTDTIYRVPTTNNELSTITDGTDTIYRVPTTNNERPTSDPARSLTPSPHHPITPSPHHPITPSPPTPQSPTPNPQSLALRQTALGLPALFVTEYALARLWMEWGVQPQAMIGHSLGEYVAACLAGVFSLEDALALVAARGRLMQQAPSGVMLNVPLPAEEVAPLLGDQLSLAAINSPAHCVVSGPSAAVETLAAALAERDVQARLVQIDIASHSRLVEPILGAFRDFVATLQLHAPTLPYISNVTGTWMAAADATDPDYWARHLRQTVRFADGMAELLAEPGRVLLEVGPGRTLSTLGGRQAQKANAYAVLPSMRHPHDRQPDVAFLLNTLGQLWLSGVPVAWEGFAAHERRRRIPLPTYPFERQRYWVEPHARAADGQRQGVVPGRKADIAEWFYIPAWKRTMPPRPFKPGDLAGRQGRWLVFLDECGVGAELAQRLEREGLRVATVLLGEHFSRAGADSYTLNPRQADGYDALLDELARSDNLPQTILHCWSVAIAAPDEAEVARFKTSQERGYYSLLFLAQALARKKLRDELRMVVVSNGAHAVYDEEVAYPEKATLSGPCKVIPLEYVHITCNTIDIALPHAGERPPGRLIDQLLAEIGMQSPDPVVAYRGRERLVQTFEPVRLSREAAPARELRAEGVYLITGGLGTVGLLLAEQLARSARARLALLGRSAFPERAAWGRWLATHEEQDDVSRTIRRLEALEALGAAVLVISADVASERQMRAALQQIDERFGALHGVIHAAGLTSGPSTLHAIPQIGYDESELQFQSKAYGLYVLERLLAERELDFCLLVSSNAAILGGLGFVAYAAANSFMDAFAAQRSRAGTLPWISTNWDVWLAAEQAPRPDVHTSTDIYAMAPRESTDAFLRIVTLATVGQVVVSAGDLLERLRIWVNRDLIKTAEQAQDLAVFHHRPKLQNAYVAPSSALEQQIAQIWQQSLGIEQIGIDDSFFELGGTSLIAIQVIARLKKEADLDVSVADLYEGLTIRSMVGLAKPARESPAGEPEGERFEEREERARWRKQYIQSRQSRRKAE